MPVALTSPKVTLLAVLKVMLLHDPLLIPVKLVTPPQLLVPSRLAFWFCVVSACQSRLPSTLSRPAVWLTPAWVLTAKLPATAREPPDCW